MKKLLLALALLVAPSSAWAVCSQIPLNIKDASSNTVAMSSASANDGNCKTIVDADPNGTMMTALGAGVGTPGSSAPSQNVLTGSVATTQEQTARTNGQSVSDASDAVGKKITLPYANPENFLNGLITTAMTGTTDTAVTGMGAQGAGVRVYVTGCVISNSSASVGTDVVLKDGSGGSVLWTFPAATNYGGTAFTFPTPIKTTANTALFAANITTGSSTKVSCTGYKGI